MRKIITLLAVIAIFSLQGCVEDSIPGPMGPPGPPGQDGLIADVIEITDVNFINDQVDNPDKGYYIYRSLPSSVLVSDQILIYRLIGTIDSNTPIWQLIPRTIYLADNNEVDYDFDFSKEDFYIYARGTYNLALTPEFLNNQTFRIVIIPGNFINSVNKNDYNAVMSTLKINEDQIQKID